jgi:alpha-L-arabinofuranosidase
MFTEFRAWFDQHKRDNREWKADTAANAEGTKNIFDKLFPAATVAQLLSHCERFQIETATVAAPLRPRQAQKYVA